jgi:CBS domain-containing protein
MSSLAHATASDAMHPGVHSCEADASLTEVARTMASHRVHCVAVMGHAPDNASEQRLWGVISDFDLSTFDIAGVLACAGS